MFKSVGELLIESPPPPRSAHHRLLPDGAPRIAPLATNEHEGFTGLGFPNLGFTEFGDGFGIGGSRGRVAKEDELVRGCLGRV